MDRFLTLQFFSLSTGMGTEIQEGGFVMEWVLFFNVWALLRVCTHEFLLKRKGSISPGILVSNSTELVSFDIDV